MPSHILRREFLAATASTVFSSGVVHACRFRRRCRCAEPGGHVRQGIMRMSGAALESLRRGVAVMKSLPPSDPRSWTFQAAIHGTDNPSATNPLFNQCEHGTLLFLPWHRGYLYFFERILRWAAEDSNLTLPYWDWTANPVLPEAFRNPAGDTNPLFETKRKANDASALPPSVVVDDLGIALRETVFPATGSQGFSPDLEDSPHGNVHTLVGGPGGLMSRVPTAAGDPIFWLHHANIDRLWNVWLNQGGGRANPSDSSYLDKQYSFADESGDTVTVRVRDIMDARVLGYRYDSVPNPAPELVAASPAPAPARMFATSAPPSKAAAELEKIEPKPLGFEENRLKLNVVKENRGLLKEALPRGGVVAPRRILVSIEGLSAVFPPDFVYRVFVNLPEGERSENVLRQHYVGSINFFGKTRADRRAAGHEHAPKGEFTATFDATRVIARLHQQEAFDPDAISVTILPVAPVPPGSSSEKVQTQATAIATRAKVSYRRISVRISE